MRKVKKTNKKKKLIMTAMVLITALVISYIYTTTKEICLVFFP